MDLTRLADFHAVTTHGGFSAAARATGTPKATVSRRVRALEEELGVRLIERGTRSLRMTDEGRALKARTAALLDDLGDVGDEIAGRAGRPRGRLRVSVSGYYAQRYFGRFTASFAATYPEVLLEATIEDRLVDPVAEGFDVVVRANPSPDSRLIGHRLLSDRFLAVATPGVPRPPSSEAAPAVVLTARSDEAWHLDGEDGPTVVRLRPVLSFASLVLIREAVLAGAGVGLMPEGLVSDELASGELVRWGVLPQRPVEVWVLYPSRRLQSAKVSAFVAMLQALHDRTSPVEVAASSAA